MLIAGALGLFILNKDSGVLMLLPGGITLIGASGIGRKKEPESWQQQKALLKYYMKGKSDTCIRKKFLKKFFS